ncbi:hypothetical protein MTR67_003501 [Solanum verrucosum]|uniref:Uncharacterized protein n=1 Tax=Solanum verrucosum TaxID=315347 RepID=A0AAF0T9E0_SOLVR|nr:hypothetical protein MTR67_003501 [Solanum verrucosum]
MQYLKGNCTLLDGRGIMMNLNFFNTTKDQLFILFLYQKISTGSNPCTCLISSSRIAMNSRLEICKEKNGRS